MIDGRPLFEYVAEKVNEWGSDYVGECGYSYVGAVVGATYPEQARITRKLMPKAYILVPVMVHRVLQRRIFCRTLMRTALVRS